MIVLLPPATPSKQLNKIKLILFYYCCWPADAIIPQFHCWIKNKNKLRADAMR